MSQFPHQPGRVPIGRQVSMTGHVLRKLADSVLAPEDASLTTWIVLHHADQAAEHHGLSQRELAGRLGIGGPGLVRHIDRLEAEGLVVRTRDTSDRRITRITLTPVGLAKLDELRVIMDASDSEMRGALTATELETLQRALEKLRVHALTQLGFTGRDDAEDPNANDADETDDR